ncbi:MAG: hypothetical protein KF819_00975 [Labilithrix sp.]|nr:hypothetical protein [Labilithrix sp.]
MAKVPSVDISTLPKLAASELRLLWVNDWYDGPLEAVVEHDGARCLMVLDGTIDVENAMRWLLFHLTAEQWVEEEKWHALFEEHVGHHWCFDHEERPEPETPRDPERFYGPYRSRAPLDLSSARPFAWVDEMPAR